jgi:hypothetical protein
MSDTDHTFPLSMVKFVRRGDVVLVSVGDEAGSVPIAEFMRRFREFEGWLHGPRCAQTRGMGPCDCDLADL